MKHIHTVYKTTLKIYINFISTHIKQNTYIDKTRMKTHKYVQQTASILETLLKMNKHV